MSRWNDGTGIEHLNLIAHSHMKILTAALMVLAAVRMANAAPLNCDLGQYRRLPGLAVQVEENALVAQWDGERGQELRAAFAIDKGQPVIRELAVRSRRGRWTTLGRNLVPEFGVTTGVRRTNHGLPEENRWDVFWDTPDRKSTRLNSSHIQKSRMPSSA